MRYSTVMAVAAIAALVLTGPGAADEERRERAGGGQSQVQVQSSVGGTITIIGPDGKVMTHSFGDASSQARRPAADADARDTEERKDGRRDGKAGTTKSFRWGKTLRITPEGGLEILDDQPDTENAAERARDAADRARRDAGPTSDREAGRAAGIERKLDAILDRLEMLERDVRALKGVDRNRE